MSLPIVSYATLGDILVGSTNPSINTRLNIGATGTVMLSTGSIPSWVATSSLGTNIAPYFTAFRVFAHFRQVRAPKDA